jgi:hypothetical protein
MQSQLASVSAVQCNCGQLAFACMWKPTCVSERSAEPKLTMRWNWDFPRFIKSMSSANLLNSIEFRPLGVAPHANVTVSCLALCFLPSRTSRSLSFDRSWRVLADVTQFCARICLSGVKTLPLNFLVRYLPFAPKSTRLPEDFPSVT